MSSQEETDMPSSTTQGGKEPTKATSDNGAAPGPAPAPATIKTVDNSQTAAEIAAKIAASATEKKDKNITAAAPTKTTAERGRSSTKADTYKDSGNSKSTRSRSKSLSRTARKAGSKLKGMVKSGMKSLRGMSGTGSSTRSNDMDSRDSSTNGPGNSLAGAEIDVVPSSGAGTANPTSASSTSPAQLELVVLLMDPTTRRFELLQLEFDSPKAKVSDLLTQIPSSVTEPALQSDNVEFVGVLDHTGVVVEGSTKLLNAFGGDTASSSGSTTTNNFNKGGTKLVLVAKPKGVSSKETLRLARPILTDKQVSKMLTSTGFDVSGWKSLKKSSPATTMKGKKSSIAKSSLTTLNSPTSGPVDVDALDDAAAADATPQNSVCATTMLAIVVIVICLQLVDKIWTRPIPSDVVLPVGTYKSRCGLVGLIPRSVRDSVIEGIESTLALDAPDFLSCDNEFLKVAYGYTESKRGNEKIVTATLYNDDGVVDMILTGHMCEGSSGAAEEGTPSKCVDGLVLRSSTMSFEMAGRPLKTATIYHGKSSSLKSAVDKQSLSPWPFVERPSKQKFKIRPQPAKVVAAATANEE